MSFPLVGNLSSERNDARIEDKKDSGQARMTEEKICNVNISCLLIDLDNL